MSNSLFSLNLSKNTYSLFTLYTFYIIYIGSLFLQKKESAISEYFSTFIGLSIFLGCFFYVKKYKLSANLLVFIVLLFFYTLLLPFVSSYLYVLLVYIKILVFIAFFQTRHIAIKDFIKFINRIYILYFILSVIVFFNFIPNVFYDPSFFLVPEFFVDFGFVSYYIMPSIQGGPASFSVFSMSVLIINYLFNQRWSMIIWLSLLGVILTFRLTPMVATGFGILLFPLFKSKNISLLILIFGFVFFILILYGLLIDFSFSLFGMTFNLWSLGYVATHARTMIWEQQLRILLNEYSMFDYIFGRFSISLFEVPHYQLWGDIRPDGLHGNPHNTFLLLFFRGPILFILFFCYFLVAVARNHNQKSFLIIFTIFMACFTDATIVSLGNPIFIIIITYFLNSDYEKKSSCSSSRF